MRTRAHEESIEIDAEPEAVFDLIHDYGRRLEWDPFLKDARLLDADAAGPGVTSRCTARNGFGGLVMDTIYVSFDRPRVAAVKMVRGPLILESFAATLKQDRIGDRRTRVTYRYNFETRPAWLRWLFNPIASRLFAREVRGRLKHLKRFLEG